MAYIGEQKTFARVKVINVSETEDIREYIYLRDIATGKVYSLRVENGELRLREEDL